MPILSNAEFEARLADMRRLMEAESLGGLIFTQLAVLRTTYGRAACPR